MLRKRGLFRRALQVTAGLLIYFSIPLFAQELQEKPSWLYIEEAKKALSQRDSALALELAYQSAKEGEMRPEAYAIIGEVYEGEGDLPFAIKNYKKALDNSAFLYIPEEKWDISYSLARVYLRNNNFILYEQTLLTLFDKESSRNQRNIKREYNYVRTLENEGLDKLLLLYRLDLSYSLEACSQLGVYYYKNKEYKSSLLMNIYTLLSLYNMGVSQIIASDPNFTFPRSLKEIEEKDPNFLADYYEEFLRLLGYDFTFQRDLETLQLSQFFKDQSSFNRIIKNYNIDFKMSSSLYTLLKMNNIPSLNPIFKEGILEKSLYYLGSSLYQLGYNKRAREVWQVVGFNLNQSKWKTLSLAKLENPNKEFYNLVY